MSDTKLSDDFDAEFQQKVLLALSHDLTFVEQISDIVKPAYFDSEGMQWMVATMMSYYQQHRTCVTATVIKTQATADLQKGDDRRSAVLELYKYMFTTPLPTDLNYVKDKFLEFCKFQELKNAFVSGVELLQKNDVTKSGKELISLFNKANQAGMSRDLGHVYHDGLDARVSQTARKTIATPWDCINKITDGGLGAGELACIIGVAGAGKTWWLRAIGAHAMTLNKVVADYTLELSENYVGLRYDAILTGIAATKIKYHVDVVRERMKNIPGKSYIKYFPMKSVTVQALASHVRRMISFGDSPDIMILDYADLLRSTERHGAKYEELGAIYEEVRGMAGEFQIPIWTASQAQRSANSDEIITGDKIAGAYAKLHTCDFVVSAARNADNKSNDTAQLHVIKNRNGPDGMTFPALMDLENVRIEVYDPNSPDGMDIMSKLQADWVPIKTKAFDPAKILE